VTREPDLKNSRWMTTNKRPHPSRDLRLRSAVRVCCLERPGLSLKQTSMGATRLFLLSEYN
jgi:hypothetical protein